MFTEADRLDMIKAVGGEEFDTGLPEPLVAVLEGEFNEPELSGIPIEGEIRWMEVRLSDKDHHQLVKGSTLVRVSDGERLSVRRFEPSRSSGFVVIRLSR